MWNLDDGSHYLPVATFKLPWAWTFADMRPGHTDREKREHIREIAAPFLASVPAGITQWAFRIYVTKGGAGRFDIENVPKLIIDSFCERQIREDRSAFAALALYPDDTIDHVT